MKHYRSSIVLLLLLLLGQYLTFHGVVKGQVTIAELLPGTEGANMGYGKYVAISGIRICIGQPFADDLGASSGKVFVFTESSIYAQDYSYEMDLVAPDGYANQQFGDVVASDHVYIIVGAQETLSSGSVYVFRETALHATDFTFVTKFTEDLASPGSAEPFNYFGCYANSLEISGTDIIVGAPSSDVNDLIGDGNDIGAAYIFSETSLGAGDFTFSVTLTIPNPSGEHTASFFGWAVYLYDQRAFIGASSEDVGSSVYVNDGALYIFDISVPGSASFIARLQDPDPNFHIYTLTGIQYGKSIAASSRRLVVGAAGGSRTYIYQETDTGLNDWNTASFVTLTGPLYSTFGRAVASNDLFVAVSFPTDGPYTLSPIFYFTEHGTVYVYQETSLYAMDFTLIETVEFAAYPKALAGEESIDLRGETLIVGAHFWDESSSAGFDGTAFLVTWGTNQCASNPCAVTGVCVDSASLFRCECDFGYSGVLCDTITPLCASSPCNNGGTCDLTSPGIFTCSCIGTGFEGDLCQTNVDDCASSPCSNGACIDGLLSFSCDCADSGYQGSLCETEINECSSSPCNAGACTDELLGFSCDCSDTGFEGLLCEIELDECLSSPCTNGVCLDDINAFICDCNATGYEGTLCESNIQECASSPCENDGVCADAIGMYICVCSDIPYEGERCHIPTDFCQSSPCIHGNCTLKHPHIQCECGDDFTGTLCETEVDHCASSPCINGNCIFQHPHIQCECGDDFTGILCETEVDRCASSPCINGGICSTDIFPFSCDCIETNYEGFLCGTPRNWCSSSPCFNGAVCVNGEANYACDCSDTGYTGAFCDTIIGNCASLDCGTNGTCIDNDDDTFCDCDAGFTGETCDTLLSSNISSSSSSSSSNCSTCVVFVFYFSALARDDDSVRFLKRDIPPILADELGVDEDRFDVDILDYEISDETGYEVVISYKPSPDDTPIDVVDIEAAVMDPKGEIARRTNIAVQQEVEVEEDSDNEKKDESGVSMLQIMVGFLALVVICVMGYYVHRRLNPRTKTLQGFTMPN